MVALQDLIDILNIEFGNYPAVFIVNKPYSTEHILFLNLDEGRNALQKVLNGVGDAEVTYVDLSADVEDNRGVYGATKIYIDVPNAFFDMGDSDTYGDGFIDFGDFESETYDRQQFFTYKDMGFYIPGRGLTIPR